MGWPIRIWAARVGMGIRIYVLPIATHLGKICTYVYRTEHYKGQLYIYKRNYYRAKQRLQ